MLSTKQFTGSPKQTQVLAKELSKIIKPKKKAFIIGLQGELGTGKTTFIQGLAKALGIKKRITSPTFVIIKKFKIKGKFKWFFHIDCYRITKGKQLLDLGFKEIVSNPENIVCIEWPENIKDILPKNIVWLKFKFKDKNTREIIVDKKNKV